MDEKLIAEAKIFHFGSLSLTDEPVRSATHKAMEIARANDDLISFDPNLREPLWSTLDEAKAQIDWGMKQSDILKISDNEITWFTGLDDYDAGIACLKDHNPLEEAPAIVRKNLAGEVHYRKAAQGVLDSIGGADNVTSAAHCATRLRLVIKDNSKVNKDAVENVDGVKGCFEASGQLQIIFGTGTVDKVFDEFIAISGLEAGTKESAREAAAQKQNWFMRGIKTLGDVFIPIIPAIVASGFLNGLLGGLSAAIPSMASSDYYAIINLMAGAALSMLPILIAISAAEKFGGNPYLAPAIGFVMIHPSLVNAWSVWSMKASDIPTWHVFGLTLQQTGYQGHVIPVIIAILFMSTLEKWLHKHVPEMFDLFVTPLVTVLVTCLLTLTVIGPVFKAVEDWIVTGAQALVGIPFGIGGLLIGFFYAFTVVAGFHHMYNMIEAQLCSAAGEGGYGNIWMPIATAANVGQGAAALAVAFKSKNEKTKSLALPSSLSAFLGITEPAIFGVNIRFRTPFIAGCCCGAIGGMVTSWLGAAANAYGITGLFRFLITLKFWWQYLAVMLVSFVISFIVSFLTFRDPETAAAAAAKKETAPDKVIMTSDKGDVIQPVNGGVIPPKDIPDPVFAGESMGPSLGIQPDGNTVYAPFDGKVMMVFPTGHAVGLSNDKGVEVLIHIGVDTVNMNGEGFTALVRQDEAVVKGQPLIRFDRKTIAEAGHPDTVIVVVTNGKDDKSVKKNI